MDISNLNKDLVSQFIGLLPPDQVQLAIAKLEQQAIESEAEAQKHLDEAKRLRAQVDELKKAANSISANKLPQVVDGLQKEKSEFRIIKRLTNHPSFRDRIISFFEDGVPKTSSELMAIQAEKYKPMFQKSFSSQLSPLKDEKIVKYTSVEIDGVKQNYYGLWDWFTSFGDLKVEYREKIKPR